MDGRDWQLMTQRLISKGNRSASDGEIISEFAIYTEELEQRRMEQEKIAQWVEDEKELIRIKQIEEEMAKLQAEEDKMKEKLKIAEVKDVEKAGLYAQASQKLKTGILKA